MAEDEDLFDDQDQEDIEEVPEETKEKKKPSKVKKYIFNLFNKVIGYVFVILLLASIFLVPYYIIQHKSKQLQVINKSVLEADIYSFPKSKKSKALASFKFPTLREKEEKEFKVKLDDMKTIVTAKLYLGYDEENEDLKAELSKRLLEIIDKIRFTIASKSYNDINSAVKREINLKKELINEINSILYNKDKKDNKIEDLYFTQFFITRLKS